jgi:hypothetical protein
MSASLLSPQHLVRRVLACLRVCNISFRIYKKTLLIPYLELLHCCDGEVGCYVCNGGSGLHSARANVGKFECKKVKEYS